MGSRGAWIRCPRSRAHKHVGRSESHKPHESPLSSALDNPWFIVKDANGFAVAYVYDFGLSGHRCARYYGDEGWEAFVGKASRNDHLGLTYSFAKPRLSDDAIS
jgi:hypothetical protein